MLSQKESFQPEFHIRKFIDNLSKSKVSNTNSLVNKVPNPNSGFKDLYQYLALGLMILTLDWEVSPPILAQEGEDGMNIQKWDFTEFSIERDLTLNLDFEYNFYDLNLDLK